MKFSQVWRGFWLVLIAVLLAGCIPHAEFKVTPQPLSAGQQGTFDASASAPFRANAGNSLVDYAWDFGDGSKANGKVATHTYARSGEYLVRLTVKDSRGFSDTSQLKLKVGDAMGTGLAKVLVRSAQGVLLANAEVGIGGVMANSNGEGVADLSGVPTGDQVVVVKKAGFVTQAQQLKLVAGEAAQVQVLLQPVKEVKRIADIAGAQAILAETLGAQIILPANAFVDAAGNPATGAVTLNWTPWDITSDDLQAMPGNGRAIGADGQMTDLISAGMMTVDFLDAQGKHLQLAPGKKATIRMDLPFTRINGVDLSEGSEIPMWTFDESLGLWKEEGKGFVVASPSSPTGLAVEAEVSHFSTWNWDFKYGNPNTLNVRCVDSQGVDVSCYVTAKIQLDGGGVLTKNQSLPAGGVNIINLPDAGTVEWVARGPESTTGLASSGLSGQVVIRLGPPPVNNFVRCTDAAGVGLACTVTMSGDAGQYGQVNLTYYLPPEGARITSSYEINGINWSGDSGKILSADQSKWLTYSGSVASGPQGNVVVVLDSTTTTSVDKQIKVRCVAGPLPDGHSIPSHCDLGLAKLDSSDFHLKFTNIPMGQIYSFNISSLKFRWLDIEGRFVPHDEGYRGWASVDLPSFDDSQVIDVEIKQLY